MAFLLNEIDSRQLLDIFKLLPLVALTRLRRTCRGLLHFIDDNIEELQPQTTHSLRISVNSLCPNNYIFVVDPSYPDTEDIYSPSKRKVLISSLNQIQRVSFKRIILIQFPKRLEEFGPKNQNIIPLLRSLGLSCKTLELRRRLNWDLLRDYLREIVFKNIENIWISYENLSEWPEWCEEINLQGLIRLGPVDYSYLHRFKSARIWSVENAMENILVDNFERYLLKIKETGSTGRLKSLTLPALETFSGHAPSLNCRRFDLVEIFNGRTDDLWSETGIAIRIYLMRVKPSQIAVVCAKETSQFTMDVVADLLEEIFASIISSLYFNYYKREHPVLLERLREKQWGEFNKIISDYMTEFKESY